MPSEEVRTIELYETFGWKIDDSRENDKGVVTLRFFREPADWKNYAKIVEYENEYFSAAQQSLVPNVFGTKKTMTILTLTGLLALILSVVFFMFVKPVWVGIIPLVWVVAVIGMWVIHCLGASKAKKVRDANGRSISEKVDRNAQILSECRAILY